MEGLRRADTKLAAIMRPDTVLSTKMDDVGNVRYALVRRLIRCGAQPHDAEDIVHEAFVRLCVAQQREWVRNPAAFLTDVVGKVRIERWRSAQRLRRLFGDDAAEDTDAVDPSPRPEEWLQIEHLLDWLWQRLGALGPRARDVFLLHRLEGLTCPEIAARHGISVSAIEKHIARSVAAIRHIQHSDATGRPL